jgi:hypothetical protein
VILGPGEGPAMDGYFAGLHELWNRGEPPSPEEERALMARFGMEAVKTAGPLPAGRGRGMLRVAPRYTHRGITRTVPTEGAR